MGPQGGSPSTPQAARVPLPAQAPAVAASGQTSGVLQRHGNYCGGLGGTNSEEFGSEAGVSIQTTYQTRFGAGHHDGFVRHHTHLPEGVSTCAVQGA